MITNGLMDAALLNGRRPVECYAVEWPEAC
jgi:hypothetical protein